MQKEYVVVTNPGTRDQKVIYKSRSLLATLAFIKGCERHSEFDLDVMRLLPDGTLTTEY